MMRITTLLGLVIIGLLHPVVTEGLEIKRVVFCREILDREPSGVINSLPGLQQGNRVYLFTEFSSKKRQVVRHRWIGGGRETEIRLNVGEAPRWRTNSYRILSQRDLQDKDGVRVEVIREDGEHLVTAELVNDSSERKKPTQKPDPTPDDRCEIPIEKLREIEAALSLLSDGTPCDIVVRDCPQKLYPIQLPPWESGYTCCADAPNPIAHVAWEKAYEVYGEVIDEYGWDLLLQLLRCPGVDLSQFAVEAEAWEMEMPMHGHLVQRVTPEGLWLKMQGFIDAKTE